MSKYKELVYMVLDRNKLSSDDSILTQDHIIFMLEKARSLLMFQYYDQQSKEIPDSLYQTICLDLELAPAIDGRPCTGGYYLKSTKKIPNLSKFGHPILFGDDYFQGFITFVPMNRFRYAGSEGSFFNNFIYATIGPDRYLYLRSHNPQYRYLEHMRMRALFENPKDAIDLLCDKQQGECDIMEQEFPIPDFMEATMIDAVSIIVSNTILQPLDDKNNASDDMSDLAYLISRLTNKKNKKDKIEDV